MYKRLWNALYLCQGIEMNHGYFLVTERHLLTRDYRVRSIDRD
jgi:hypothetical protein